MNTEGWDVTHHTYTCSQEANRFRSAETQRHGRHVPSAEPCCCHTAAGRDTLRARVGGSAPPLPRLPLLLTPRRQTVPMRAPRLYDERQVNHRVLKVREDAVMLRCRYHAMLLMPGAQKAPPPVALRGTLPRHHQRRSAACARHSRHGNAAERGGRASTRIHVETSRRKCLSKRAERQRRSCRYAVVRVIRRHGAARAASAARAPLPLPNPRTQRARRRNVVYRNVRVEEATAACVASSKTAPITRTTDARRSSVV